MIIIQHSKQDNRSLPDFMRLRTLGAWYHTTSITLKVLRGGYNLRYFYIVST